MISGVTTMELTAIDHASGVINRVKGATDGMTASYERLKNLLIGGLSFGTIYQSLRQITQAASEAEQASNRLTSVMKAIGHSVGVTKKEIDDLADSMAQSTQFDDESLRNASATILKFGNIYGQVFRDTLKASADLAAFLGTNVVSAAQLVGKSVQSPTDGLMMMERQFGKLTVAEKENIESLAEHGKAVEAQNAVLDLWRAKIGGTADLMNTSLLRGTRDVTKGWNELIETMGKLNTLRINDVLGGLATLLGDIRKTLEGTRNTLADLMTDMAVYLSTLSQFIPSLRVYVELLSRAGRTSSGTIGGLGPPVSPPPQVVLGGEVKKASEAAAKERQRLLDLDTKGWIAHAQAIVDEDFRVAKELAESEIKLSELSDKLREKSITEDAAAYAAREEAAEDLLIFLGKLELQALEKRIADELAAQKKIADARKDQEKEISRGLTDSLMRGFEAGTRFARNFWASMVNMAKTIVVRPIIEGALSPVSGAITAGITSMGFPGAASAAGGALSLASAGSQFMSGLSAWEAGGSVMTVLSNPALYSGLHLLGTAIPIIGGALIAAKAFGLFDSDDAKRNPWLSITTSGAGAQAGTLAATEVDLKGGSPAFWSQVNAWLDQLPDRVKTAVDNVGLIFEPDTTAEQAWAAMEQQILAVASGLNLTGAEMQRFRSIADQLRYTLETAGPGLLNAHVRMVAVQRSIGDQVASFAQRVTDLQTRAADAMRAFAGSIDMFLASVSPASQSYGALKRSLAETAALARTGDTTAQGNLLSIAAAFDAAAKAQSVDAADYARNRAYMSGLLIGVRDAVKPLTAAIDPAQELADAQRDYQKALALTTGLQYDAGDALSDLRATVIEYQDASAALSTAQAEFWAGNVKDIETFIISLSPSQVALFVGALTPDTVTTFLTAFDATRVTAFLARLDDLLLSAFMGKVPTAQNAAATAALTAAGATERWVGDTWWSSGGAHGTAAGAITGRTGDTFTAIAAQQMINDALAAGNPMAVYEGLRTQGVSANSAEQLMGWASGAVNAWADVYGLPHLARGTDYMPRDMPIFAHQGERVTPAAYNRSDATNEELLAEVKNLRLEIVKLQKPANETADATMKTKDTMQQVSRGGLSWQTRAAGT